MERLRPYIVRMGKSNDLYRESAGSQQCRSLAVCICMATYKEGKTSGSEGTQSVRRTYRQHAVCDESRTYGVDRSKSQQGQTRNGTITFNTCGGTEIPSITQDYGTAIIAPADPTKTGYTFVGWEPALPTTMPAGNLELKAKWEVKQYTLTWVVQETKVTYNFGEEITPLVAPEKTGYTFAGWDTDIPATMPAENITITAKWTVVIVIGDESTDGELNIVNRVGFSR